MVERAESGVIGPDRDWRQLMRTSCCDVAYLGEKLHISGNDLEKLASVQELFPVLVNPYYLTLIDSDNPDDPIRKMSVPSVSELDVSGHADTSGEAKSTVLPGLQHKYSETALILSTAVCAMNCRYCFRRRFVGASQDEVVQSIDDVAGYIAEHREITNVLVSGGDAFMNSNEVIGCYLELLTAIDHVRSIRFGTRTPVTLPQRITSDSELVELLAKYAYRKQLYVVTQFNHAAEITPESTAAVQTLLRVGVPVRNQTVLLRGVNDRSDTLVDLMDGLVAIGVMPYYLFQCRPVTGVKSRFQVPLREGVRIVNEAQANLNGLAKSFRFMMSHETGKIEILGCMNDAASEGAVGVDASADMLFKYHQARDRSNLGKVFTRALPADACWL